MNQYGIFSALKIAERSKNLKSRRIWNASFDIRKRFWTIRKLCEVIFNLLFLFSIFFSLCVSVSRFLQEQHARHLCKRLDTKTPNLDVSQWWEWVIDESCFKVVHFQSCPDLKVSWDFNPDLLRAYPVVLLQVTSTSSVVSVSTPSDRDSLIVGILSILHTNVFLEVNHSHSSASFCSLVYHCFPFFQITK